MRSLADVDILGLCWRLEAAVLEGNPVAGLPGYRPHVAAAVPTLLTLDEAPVTAEERAAGQAAAEAGPGGGGGGGSAESSGDSAAELAGEAAVVAAAVKGARVGFDSHEYEEVPAAGPPRREGGGGAVCACWLLCALSALLGPDRQG